MGRANPEASPTTPATTVDDDETVGHPLPGVTVTFRQDELSSPEPDASTSRARAVSTGYLGESDGEFCDGGFLTGDYGRLDDQRTVALTGRVSTFINVAGKKVQPAEVEDVLRQMPGVRDARVRRRSRSAARRAGRRLHRRGSNGRRHDACRAALLLGATRAAQDSAHGRVPRRDPADRSRQNRSTRAGRGSSRTNRGIPSAIVLGFRFCRGVASRHYGTGPRTEEAWDERVEAGGAGTRRGSQTRLASLSDDQSPVRGTAISSQVGAGAAAQEQPANQAAARMAAHDRLALPDVRARDAGQNPLRRAVARIARERARRRDQGAHPRARRQGHHREDLPDARHVHRHARHRPGVPAPARVALPRPRLSRRHRDAAQPRHVVHPAWPRRGAHDRPDEPLQHDVRPVLHGCEPGRLRARAHVAGGEAAARRRAQHQAPPPDDGAVLGRRADDLADLPRRGALRARDRLLQRAGRHQRHPLRAGRRVRARRRATPACGSPICSSTG